MENFVRYLQKELDRRGWTAAELARRANISQGTLSRILNMERSAGGDTCLGIARALNVPPEEVMRRAGLLPPVPPEDASLRQLIDYARQLTASQREEVLRYAMFSGDPTTPPQATTPPPAELPEQLRLPLDVPAPDLEDILEVARLLDGYSLRQVYDFARWALWEQEHRRNSDSKRPVRTWTPEQERKLSEALSEVNSDLREALMAYMQSFRQDPPPNGEPTENESTAVNHHS